MTLFLLVRIAVLVLCFSTTVYSKCPDDSILLHTECYKFFDTPKTYSVAENICEKNNAKLTSVRSELENTDINGQAGRFLTLYGTTVTWLGINDLKIPNQWIWEDGNQSGFTKWQKGDPKLNDTVHNCGAMWIENGFWFSADCYSEMPFICKINKPPPPPPPPKTTPPCNCNKTTAITKPLLLPMTTLKPPMPTTTILPILPTKVTTIAAPIPPPKTTVPPKPLPPNTQPVNLQLCNQSQQGQLCHLQNNISLLPIN